MSRKGSNFKNDFYNILTYAHKMRKAVSSRRSHKKPRKKQLAKVAKPRFPFQESAALTL